MPREHAGSVPSGRPKQGAAGVDRMTVDQLWPWCQKHGPTVRDQILEGTYMPKPVRKVEIPKPGGGIRVLGIPTVVDRMIQQALSQVLGPICDPTFSEASFGFRPGRSTHDAVQAAKGHIAEGHRWVVDMDLEKFFDRVNQGVSGQEAAPEGQRPEERGRPSVEPQVSGILGDGAQAAKTASRARVGGEIHQEAQTDATPRPWPKPLESPRGAGADSARVDCLLPTL